MFGCCPKYTTSLRVTRHGHLFLSKRVEPTNGHTPVDGLTVALHEHYPSVYVVTSLLIGFIMWAELEAPVCFLVSATL